MAGGHHRLVDGPEACAWQHSLLGVFGCGVHQRDGVQGAGAPGVPGQVVRLGYPLLRLDALEYERRVPVAAPLGLVHDRRGLPGVPTHHGVEAVEEALGGEPALGAHLLGGGPIDLDGAL